MAPLPPDSVKLQTFEDIILLGIFLQFDVMQDILRGCVSIVFLLDRYVILLITVHQEPKKVLYLCTVLRFRPSPFKKL